MAKVVMGVTNDAPVKKTTTKSTTTPGVTLAAANNGGKTVQTTNVNNAAAVNGAASDGGNTGKTVDYSILDAIDKQVNSGVTGTAAVSAAKQAQAAEKSAVAANTARTQQANQKVTAGQPVSNPGDLSVIDRLDQQIANGVTGDAALKAADEDLYKAKVINDQITKGVSNPGNLSVLDEIDAQVNKGNPAWAGTPSVDTPVTNTGNGGGQTPSGNGGQTPLGNGDVTVNTNITNQNPTPTQTTGDQIAGVPVTEPAPVVDTPIKEAAAQVVEQAVTEAVGPYGLHSHEIAATETQDIQKEIEQILQAEYDKYGELTKQQIEYAMQQAINELQRQLEDAAPAYNAERAKLAANQLNARDNLALRQAAEGVNGGIAAKQYSDQEAAYDSQMLNINLQQIQLSTDIGRQVADLEAQGDYEAAKALLEVGIAKLQELQDAKQNYQSLRIQQAQILDNYDMQSDQTTYNRALQRLQMGAFSAADAAAIGVDPSFAQEYANYINDLNKINAEQARVQLQQQIVALDNARNGVTASRSGTGTAETDEPSTVSETGGDGVKGNLGSYSTGPVNGIVDGADAQMFRYGLDNGGVRLMKLLNSEGKTRDYGILSTDGKNYTLDGKAYDIPFGAMIAIDGDQDGTADLYFFDDNIAGYGPTGLPIQRGWVSENDWFTEHPLWPGSAASADDIARTMNQVNDPMDEYGFATYDGKSPTTDGASHAYHLNNIREKIKSADYGLLDSADPSFIYF